MKLIKILSLSIITLLFLLLSEIPILTPPDVSAQAAPPVLAFYYAWFDQNTWTSKQSVDLPAEFYTSADRATVERHVLQAQSAGIDAFVQSWYGPQEVNNQTETNFRTLLDIAQAAGFKAAVDVETTGPFLGDAGAVTQALASLLTTHTQHPAYLRYQDKPVIFFWRQQRFSLDEWAAIRGQVDPDHNSYWIAEGVDIAYQDVFDGHHLYSIAWAASPADQLAKWGDRVRNYEADHQVDRLWVATAMPGYDDTQLPRDNAFAVPRRDGDYYRETWRGAVASQPDMIIITSFNEWLEGTHIEPSAAYGNLYLDVTRELATELRGQAPAAPPVTALTQATDPPDGPYIEIGDLTNVRQGPSTNLDIIGQLPAGSFAAVTGQTEAGDWWQIEFADGPDGQGWVSAEVVEFVGEATEVPVVEAPAVEEGADQETADSPAAENAAEPTEGEAEEVTAEAPRVQATAGEVNVRSGPGLDFDLLGRLDEGASAMVVARNETGDWWQIEYEAGENGLGWVADVVVDFIGDSQSLSIAQDTAGAGQTALPEATPTPAGPIVAGSVEAIDPINVRAEPSVDGERVGGLYPGESADVFAISEDGGWWQIDFPDAPGGVAWVAAEFVEFQGEETAVPIFGQTPTPTPSPTHTPTPVPPALPTPTVEFPPTYAPTATSVYQATSAAVLADRGTPDPTLTELPAQPSLINWRTLPWGILSVVVVAGLLWYQFSRSRRRRGPRF